MTYDFTSIMDRHGMDAIAVDALGTGWAPGAPKAAWDVGVAWQDGRMFGGTHTIRMNLALPKTRVEEAFRRLQEYVFV